MEMIQNEENIQLDNEVEHNMIIEETPLKVIEGDDMEQTKIIFHTFGLKDIDIQLKVIFLVKDEEEDNFIKRECIIKQKESYTLELDSKINYSKCQLSIQLTEEDPLLYSYSCRIYSQKANYIYYNTDKGKCNMSFYINQYEGKNMNKWQNREETITWNKNPRLFRATLLSSTLKCFTILNIPENFTYSNIDFPLKEEHIKMRTHIKVCLYLKEDVSYYYSAFILNNNVQRPDNSKKKAKDALKRFIFELEKIMNNHLLSSDIKKVNIVYLYNNNQSIDEMPYFSDRLITKNNYSEEDYSLFSNYLLFLCTSNLKTKLRLEFEIFVIRYNLLLDIIKKYEYPKTIENLHLACFSYSVIMKIKNVTPSNIIEIIPVNFNDANPNEKSNENYRQALTYIDNIIDLLKEDSSLVQVLKQLNSPISENLLNKNNNEFELDYLPLKILKSHLKDLLKTPIVRYFSNSDENGMTCHITQCIVGINEFQLFNFKNDKSNCHDDDNKSCSIILAIVMVLLHELFGHSKIRHGNLNNETPQKFIKNGKFLILTKRGRGEAKEILGNFISEDATIHTYLRHSDNVIAKKILDDPSLFTDINFDRLHFIVKSNISITNNQKISNDQPNNGKSLDKSNNSDGEDEEDDSCYNDIKRKRRYCHYCS